jgi:hypothetical protein
MLCTFRSRLRRIWIVIASGLLIGLSRLACWSSASRVQSRYRTDSARTGVEGKRSWADTQTWNDRYLPHVYKAQWPITTFSPIRIRQPWYPKSRDCASVLSQTLLSSRLPWRICLPDDATRLDDWPELHAPVAIHHSWSSFHLHPSQFPPTPVKTTYTPSSVHA